MSKAGFVKNPYVPCFVCRGEVLRDDLITITIKGLLENGQKYNCLVTVCWFCMLDVKKPLPVCLSSSSNLNANQKQAVIRASELGRIRKP